MSESVQGNNGEVKAELPTIKLTWDPANQSVGLKFDPKEFKSWDFILALLEQAKLGADVQRQMHIGRVMQQQAFEHQKAQQQVQDEMRLRAKLKL